ncbi:MAG: cardiolipin synthase [Clostridia bacterium]|nr:cardiolipin synthase [Clostridia bacterium]
MSKKSQINVDKKIYSKNPMRSFFTDMFVISVLAALQIALMIVSIWNLYKTTVYVQLALSFISLLVVVYIINKHDSTSFKLAWAVPILLFPAFGGIMYLYCQVRVSTFRFKKRIEKINQQIVSMTERQRVSTEQFRLAHPSGAPLSGYLEKSGFPFYANTRSVYFPSGEAMYEELLKQLRLAEEYIFLEFFIVHEGQMWDGILEILKEKAANGVDVRLMYDGMGSITTLPRKYHKTLQKLGINTVVFNPFVPVISTMQNNRDHRKIVAIDGRVAFTGGVNLSDEYINAVTRFGKWKDSAIMVTGDAAAAYSLMFLRSWNIFRREPDTDERYIRPSTAVEGDGYYAPYCDSPFDEELIARNVYLNLINRANKYIYIMTPYLILDEELESALMLAADSGIDVRIITPHHADKKYVHMMTRYSYPALIKRGIKIYEYEPGFLHSKNILVDDKCAVVGSVNFDYRSLYLHFECAQLLYDSPSITQIKEDFTSTFDISIPITQENCKKDKGLSRLITQLLKVFSPLF